MYASETFGRLFWLDDDYVSEWDDWSEVNMNELLNIHKFCILNKTEYAGSLTHREVN